MIEIKPITQRRRKNEKLARVAVETIVNNNGTYDDIAEKMPERFGNLQPDSTGSKRQHVYARLRNPEVQQAIQRLLPQATRQNIADEAQNRLSEILQPGVFDPDKGVSPRYLEMGLRIDGRLVDQTVIKHEFGNVPKEIVDMAADEFLGATEAQYEDIGHETDKV